MTNQDIKDLVSKSKVIVFGKGEKGRPYCGFTARMQDIFDEVYPDYEMINILSDSALREKMREYSDWPTYPQIYVDGEFIGGGDIVMDMYDSGELEKLIF